MTVSTVLREMENTPVLVQLGFADQHTNDNQVHKHLEHVSLLLLSQQLKLTSRFKFKGAGGPVRVHINSQM